MKKLVALLLLFSFGLSGSSNNCYEVDMKYNPEIYYCSNVADETFPMSFLITKNRMALLTLRTNRGEPPIAVVGKFQSSLSEQQLVQLVERLRSEDFINIKNPDKIVPGETIRKLSIKEEYKKEVMRFVAESTPPPPVFLTIEALVLNLIGQVRKHPKNAISIQIEPISTLVKPEVPLHVNFKIINAGSDNIQIQNPKYWTEETTQIELIAIRNDIPADDAGLQHQRFEKITRTSIATLQSGEITKPLIILPPGDLVSLEFLVNLAWPPGSYNCQFSFASSLGDIKETETTNVEIISEAINIKLVQKSK